MSTGPEIILEGDGIVQYEEPMECVLFEATNSRNDLFKITLRGEGPLEFAIEIVYDTEYTEMVATCYSPNQHQTPSLYYVHKDFFPDCEISHHFEDWLADSNLDSWIEIDPEYDEDLISILLHREKACVYFHGGLEPALVLWQDLERGNLPHGIGVQSTLIQPRISFPWVEDAWAYTLSLADSLSKKPSPACLSGNEQRENVDDEIISQASSVTVLGDSMDLWEGNDSDDGEDDSVDMDEADAADIGEDDNVERIVTAQVLAAEPSILEALFHTTSQNLCEDLLEKDPAEILEDLLAGNGPDFDALIAMAEQGGYQVQCKAAEEFLEIVREDVARKRAMHQAAFVCAGVARLSAMLGW
ncbi:MAG: hypothetical protein Q9222_002206 [Ikaeria aurantiellina]